MQILLIILVASLFLNDDPDVRRWLQAVRPDWSVWVRVTVWLGAFLVVERLHSYIQRRARRIVERSGSRKALRRSEVVGPLAILFVVIVQVGALAFFDIQAVVRDVVGDLILIDEVIVLAPALLSMVLIWNSQYSMSRLLREAELMRRLDRGEVVYPIWTRGEYLLALVRLHFVMILLPITLLIGWRELIDQLALGENAIADILAPSLQQNAVFLLGVFIIFLFTPVMVRHLWDATSLPPGEIRNRLLQMCRIHRIRIRDLLLWNTYGGMMNGAVMGLIGRFRYILLTDALLDALSPTQIEAVMAHELGHVRRRHFPALILALIAIVVGMSFLGGVALEPFTIDGSMRSLTVAQLDMKQSISEEIGSDWTARLRELWSRVAERPDDATEIHPPVTGTMVEPQWIEPTVLGGVLAFGFLSFGWVSRRFERQADTFAVQHLSGMRDSGAKLSESGENPCVITRSAVDAMVGTLGVVACLNHIPKTRRSWRHGSIAWRQKHLESLVGLSCRNLAIDRQIFIIKVIAMIIVVAGFISYFRMELS